MPSQDFLLDGNLSLAYKLPLALVAGVTYSSVGCPACLAHGAYKEALEAVSVHSPEQKNASATYANGTLLKRSDCMRVPVLFHCPGCNKRLRASARFVGRSSSCPSCGEKVTVPPVAPEEAAPMLVMDDGHRTSRQSFRA